MAVLKKRVDFFQSAEGLDIRTALHEMVTNAAYNTDSSYSANTDTYPDHQIPFVDKHMNYLSTHPSTDAQHYLSNLRLMIRVR